MVRTLHRPPSVFDTAKIEKAFELCKRMNISSPHLLVSDIVATFAGEERANSLGLPLIIGYILFYSTNPGS